MKYSYNRFIFLRACAKIFDVKFKKGAKPERNSMSILTIINIIIGSVLGLCYLYQFVFLIIAYVKKQPIHDAKKINRIAVLISARNEEGVLPELLSCLEKQDYPRESFDVFVVADNCTDGTADAARRCGAFVYERENKTEIGKGYAIDFLIRSIAADRGDDAYDAYLIFDADNLVEPNFLTEINKTFSQGYDCVTSYRNSKNYGDSWIAAGQGMTFMRDLILLNRARMLIGGCCFVAGTGFMFSRKLCRSFGGGWPFHTLTEDGEFTTHNAIEGNKLGYCDRAKFYDEQPTGLRQSCRQRLRWCKGYLQIIRGYYPRLLRRIFSRDFLSCADMALCMAPAYILSILAVIGNIVGAVLSIVFGTPWTEVLLSLGIGIVGIYLVLLMFSLCLTISEWRQLKTTGARKILYMFTFPLYMFTFVPICFVALFKRNVGWKPIKHESRATLEELSGKK